MNEARYAFPLHSFVLLGPREPPLDDPLYLVPVPEGRLALRPEQRRRGEFISTADTERALHEALAHQALVCATLSPFGLGLPWAESMRHWWERLRALEVRRIQTQARGQLLLRAHRERIARAKALWRRLALSVKVAGIAGLSSNGLGRQPQAELAFIEALQQLARRAQENEAPLAAASFGPERLAALVSLSQELGPGRQAIADLSQAAREVSAAIQVVRGALLADLAHLAEVATQVLPRDLSRPLLRKALFARDPTPPAPY